MSKLEPTRTNSNPTATDILRRMLDECGVEWWQSVNMLGCVFTRWYSPLFSDEVVAMENGDGELELFSHLMTPEQAIAATLGATDAKPTQVESSGTCRNVYEKGHFKCSECGHYTQTRMVYRDGAPADPRFCPWCGRKVVEPTTNDVGVKEDA